MSHDRPPPLDRIADALGSDWDELTIYDVLDNIDTRLIDNGKEHGEHLIAIAQALNRIAAALEDR